MSEFDLTTDVVIVGGGPAGLACAWRLKQLNPDLSVTLLEKAASPGAQLVSGAVMDPAALDQLWPEWRAHVPHDKVSADEMFYLFGGLAVPLPCVLNNKKGLIVSLAGLGAALAEQATNAGVDILPGYAGQGLIGTDRIEGVVCGDGTRIGARHVVLAEGCFGSLSEEVIGRFNLRGDRHQTYGLGIKEIWRVQPERHRPGQVTHTIGWPLPCSVYGGGFMFHYGDNLVSLGLITGLDYDNPTLSPFGEMQMWKTHPHIAKTLEGATRVSYQARALVEGGWSSKPRCDFPGGVLIGDAAGFLDAAHLKGIHMSLWSGMLAAEAFVENTLFENKLPGSPLMRALWKARNVRAGFNWGQIPGMLHAGFQILGGWALPYTLSGPAKPDRHHYDPQARPRLYPAPDHVLTFDKLSSLRLSNLGATGPDSHLLLADPALPEQRTVEPSPAYCPAGVYEFVNRRFVINHANCVHCKTCAIKDPDGNITWVPPLGGSGPSYESL